MEITLLQIVLVFIVACIAGMESVLDEFQFHRPLVACTLIGAVLGDMKTGIIIGGTLEMIALGWMNIGAAVAPDAALASIISTVLVIAGHQSIGAGIALAIPLAAAGQGSKQDGGSQVLMVLDECVHGESLDASVGAITGRCRGRGSGPARRRSSRFHVGRSATGPAGSAS